MNLNEIARRITLREGKKKSLSIGQVKEVMRLFLEELRQHPLQVITELLKTPFKGRKGKK